MQFRGKTKAARQRHTMKKYKHRYAMARDCNDSTRRLIWDRLHEIYIAHGMRLSIARKIVALLNKENVRAPGKGA